MKIEATEQEAQAWLNLINEGLKVAGLPAAQAALLFQQRVSEAVQQHDEKTSSASQ
jgi:truncated hemoglobin YjbI